MIGNLKYRNASGGEVEFDISTGFIISEMSGLTENSITLSTSQGFTQIGSTVQGTSVEEKPISIEGTILGYAKDQAALLLDTILPDVIGQLIYNDEWAITVYPTETPYVEQYDHNPKFQFSLTAPYPYWSKAQETNVSLAGIEPMFSFPWDLSQSFTFGTRLSPAFAWIYNPGSVESLYSITFRAMSEGVTNPRITNAKTYEYLHIKKDMALGETITVSITYGGVNVTSDIGGTVTDIIGYFDIQSDLYRMHPGDNVIAYNADTGRDNLDVNVTFNVGTVWVRGRD